MKGTALISTTSETSLFILTFSSVLGEEAEDYFFGRGGDSSDFFGLFSLKFFVLILDATLILLLLSSFLFNFNY